MPKEKAAKPPPLKIGEWPWWLESPYVTLWVYLGWMGLEIFFALIQRRLHNLVVVLVFSGGLLGIYLLGRVVYGWYTGPRKDADILPTICPGCGYDLRATPLRCPECGADTPFKKWLDEHPLDRAIYEGKLKPRGSAEAD